MCSQIQAAWSSQFLMFNTRASVCQLTCFDSSVIFKHGSKLGHFYRPQGKVMFSQLSVCPQSASWTLAHCSTLLRGRYASYWNAFLFVFLILNSTAKTKLAILAFLYCGEIMKNSSGGFLARDCRPSRGGGDNIQFCQIFRMRKCTLAVPLDPPMHLQSYSLQWWILDSPGHKSATALVLSKSVKKL